MSTESSSELQAQGALAATVREVVFSTAMRGYDRAEVDRFMASLAKQLEAAKEPTRDDDAWGSGVVKRELERVGESTKNILAAAEEVATRLRADATREVEEARRAATDQVDKLRSEAEEAAARTREAAADEVRRLRLDASTKAEETVSSAEARAEELVESAIRQKRVLEAKIERMVEQRDRLVDDLARLGDQLSAIASEVEGELADPLAPPEPDVAPRPAPHMGDRDEPIFDDGAERGRFDDRGEFDHAEVGDEADDVPDRGPAGPAAGTPDSSPLERWFGRQGQG